MVARNQEHNTIMKISDPRKKMNRLLFVVVSLFGIVHCANNGVGRTPQMGWNSWNYWHCSVNETIIRQAADIVLSSGMKQVGYEYINVDDCWAWTRLPNGTITADPTTFPSGMKALADYVHSLGLKFGLYTDAGNLTCAGRPGSLGYEALDAQTYADWGVDYLKEDWCSTTGLSPPIQYGIMHEALNATGRPIFFSLCNGGIADPWIWGPPIANSWRTTVDIENYWASVMWNLDQQVGLAKYAGPGGWNDPDMLMVGVPGLSLVESISHFALWAVINAPLIAGNDLTNMSQEVLEILTAPEVIAINQDPLGIEGTLVDNSSFPLQVWAKPLADGSMAAVLLNRDDGNTLDITLQWEVLGLADSTKAVVRDLWAREDIGVFAGSYTSQNVPPHGSATVRITPLGSVEARSAGSTKISLK